MVNNLDEALRILKNAVRKKEALSVGLVGNCADVIPELAERGVLPDILTDQTSAHDPLNGYVPNGMTWSKRWSFGRMTQGLSGKVNERDGASRGRHAALAEDGSVTFDYGNNIRTFAFQQGVKDAYDFPGLYSLYPSTVLRRRGPFRWVALSGDQPILP